MLHLGDITQHDAPAEWEVAKRSFAVLDGVVPYALAPGNHDCSGGGRKTRLNEYFSVDKPAFPREARQGPEPGAKTDKITKKSNKIGKKGIKME